MPVEIGIWRIDQAVTRVSSSRLEDETRLEDAIEEDISILGLDLLLIVGRQVLTAYGKWIDVLAIDAEGVLYVVELKRDRTPREVVAQLLDYGSWVTSLSADEIEEIYSSQASNSKGFAEAFRDRFGTDLPETLNDSHRLIVVASELDGGSERIVDYLSTNYGVPINALFFRYFRDGSAEYIARSWLLDPVEAEGRTTRGTRRTQEPWNGHDFYISFGEDEARTWQDAHRYGFVSGGGGRRYSGPLSLLEPGHRVFVNVPSKGYVGVGVVTESSQPVKDFMVEVDGVKKPILEAPIGAERMDRDVNDADLSEYLVRVKWIKAVPVEKAYRETGFFGNQNVACRFRHRQTLEKLYRHFGVSEDPNDDTDRPPANVES